MSQVIEASMDLSLLPAVFSKSEKLRAARVGQVSLDDVIKKLHQVFAEDSVNVEVVHDLLASYHSNPEDWKRFAKFDPHRYTRNLVDEGNGKFNLIVVCWGEAHGSAVHDHSDSHCFMKILEGELLETRFHWPEDNGELVKKSEGKLKKGEVCYINDSLGLHRVENPSHSDRAVSLHLYSPPFDMCHVFNQKTGKKSSCNVTFWSKYGEKNNTIEHSAIAPEDN